MDKIAEQKNEIRRITLAEKILSAALLLTFIHSCDQSSRIETLQRDIVRLRNIRSSPAPVIGVPTPVALTEEQREARIRLLPHNYIQEESRLYFYEAPLSEEDQERNRGTRDVLPFRYFGENEDGFHIIKSYLGNDVISTIKCKRPCRVIEYNGEVITPGNNTVLNDVVLDAMRGALLVSE